MGRLHFIPNSTKVNWNNDTKALVCGSSFENIGVVWENQGGNVQEGSSGMRLLPCHFWSFTHKNEVNLIIINCDLLFREKKCFVFASL